MILVAIIFILFGILVKYGKMYNLIAGFNSMPKDVKEKYIAGGFASVIGNALFGMALVIIIGNVVSTWLVNQHIEFYSLIAAILVGIPYILIKSNSDKYKVDKNKMD